MSSINVGFDETRLQKRARLLEAGVDPYPYSYDRRVPIADVRAGGDEPGADRVAHRVVGRIWSRRNMGKTVFLDLKDDSASIQLYVKQDLAPAAFDLLDALDLGDIIGVTGAPFRTKSGELTLAISELQVLAKVVVSLPIGKETEEGVRYRVVDPEMKYRERYSNWILDDEARTRMLLRGRIVSSIRRHMEESGFLEVLTPTIEPVYGGAEARPFRTSVWALSGQEMFLRISPELYLKRYIVGGFPKVFTICQNFRNEGIDRSHNPEFTMMEWYEAFTDYQDQMVRFESLVASVCMGIHGTTAISYGGRPIDFAPPWRRVTVLDEIRRCTGVDAGVLSAGEIEAECNRRGFACGPGASWGVAVMALFEGACEPSLFEPTFVMDHPLDISPLTKRKRGDARLVERFEPFAAGMEIGNAYSELTDPVEQLERLIDQQRGRGAAEYENHPVDEDFIRAVGCGMPPTGGVGLGIDRLIMLLTDARSIRDVIPFPMMRRRAAVETVGPER